jgi:hypothetical protein
LNKLEELLHPTYLESTAQLDILFNDFSNGTLVSVSDGSYFPETKQAACAWLIESSCRSQWIMGSVRTPGTHDVQSAYRSEVAGLWAISMTHKLLSCCLPQPKHLIVGCDGKAALNILSSSKNCINASSQHSDLTSVIIDLWSSMNVLPHPVHILGHQDATTNRLNRFEIMNVLVDRLATLTAPTRTPTSQSNRAPTMGMDVVKYKDKQVCGDMYSTLYNSITQDRLMEYLSHKIVSSPAVTLTIDLRSFAKARRCTTTSMIKFVTKWISNTIATGVILQRRNHRIFNRCPRCNAWGEDKVHVVVCWDIRAKVIWDRQMEYLKSLMLSLNTHPEIYSFIIQGLARFRTHPHSPSGPQEEQEVWKQEQREIGWLNFLSGFISTKIVQLQHDHYKTLGLRRTGHTWAEKIISHGWQLIYKLWLGRNEVLHRKEVINSLSGELLLDIEVEKEYNAGYKLLPRSIHKWFFYTIFLTTKLNHPLHYTPSLRHPRTKLT